MGIPLMDKRKKIAEQNGILRQTYNSSVKQGGWLGFLYKKTY